VKSTSEQYLDVGEMVDVVPRLVSGTAWSGGHREVVAGARSWGWHVNVRALIKHAMHVSLY
jgi:hypothetical protein